MPENLEQPDGTDHPSSRRRYVVVAGVGLLCVLAVAAGLFAVLRSDGDDTGSNDVTEVTFGPEAAATSIPTPPPNSGPELELSVASGPAGSEVTLQGAGFRGGRDVSRIELYWDRVGGQSLETVDGPRFSVQLTIPADAPVINEGHNVVAVQRDKDKNVVMQTSIPFFVVPPRP